MSGFIPQAGSITALPLIEYLYTFFFVSISLILEDPSDCTSDPKTRSHQSIENIMSTYHRIARSEVWLSRSFFSFVRHKSSSNQFLVLAIKWTVTDGSPGGLHSTLQHATLPLTFYLADITVTIWTLSHSQDKLAHWSELAVGQRGADGTLWSPGMWVNAVNLEGARITGEKMVQNQNDHIL